MKRFIVTLLLLSVPAYAEDTEGAGRFRMYLSLDSGWHHHELEVQTYGPGGAKGIVSIDRGIGPEARTPTADEKVHRVPFQAEEDPGTGALTFTVTVGSLRPARYAFELYPIRQPDGFVWVGTVRVTQGETGQGKCGVLAVPFSEGSESLRMHAAVASASAPAAPPQPPNVAAKAAGPPEDRRRP